MNKALPCPFCGGTDIIIGEGSSFRWRVAHCACGVIGPDVRIQTMGSGTQAEWEERAQADAIEAWNKRAPLQQTEKHRKTRCPHGVHEQNNCERCD